MTEPTPYQANFDRGSLMLQQKRYEAAAEYFQAALAANPNVPRGYAQLARCWDEIPAAKNKVIPTIDRAIALAPTASACYGLKAWFLFRQFKYQEAIRIAQEGLSIDPNCNPSLTALANVYTKLHDWSRAVEYCHRILALDPENGPGLNLLAQALRELGAWKESRAIVGRLLAKMPDNAFGHANAGYSALAVGDHSRANHHFLTSLRMDPHFELARRGLLESLRARFWLDRLKLRLSLWLGFDLRQAAQLTLVIAVAVGAALCVCDRGFLNFVFGSWSGKVLITGEGICLLAIALVALAVMATTLANFSLLFDPLGRHALTPKEKLLATVPVAGYTLIFATLLLESMLIAAGIGLGLIIVLFISAQYPLLKDRWLRRREAESID